MGYMRIPEGFLEKLFTPTLEELETEVRKELEKDENGLYIHAPNYQECKDSIEATKKKLNARRPSN